MADNLEIVFLLFPKVTQLDFTGPLQILSRLPGARVHIAWKDCAPVETDTLLKLLPSTSFDDCPQADVLCIPGGFGVDAVITDEAAMAFVARQAAGARYVTSVCTGAFVLGAAGLLKGKNATTHWAYHDTLTEVGAIPVKERVVRDGPIITGGGVTAGIDFAFSLAAEIAGDDVAKRIMLGVEYDPNPPFPGGSPQTAEATTTEAVAQFYAPRLAEFRKNLAKTQVAP